MVGMGDADGSIGGAVNTTAETVRAALHAIGPAPGIRTVSGAFLMAHADARFGKGGVMTFADCAVVVDPDAAKNWPISRLPRPAPRGSFWRPSRWWRCCRSRPKAARDIAQVDKVVEALRIVRERAPGAKVDGELQLDAALIPAVGASKAPGSLVAGQRQYAGVSESIRR